MILLFYDLVQPQGDGFARCDRQPTAPQDDHSGSAVDHVVVRPLLDWLLGGRQVSLVGLTAVEVLSCFMLSAHSQELVPSIRKEVPSSVLTMGDSDANKNDGWGYDGEDENHRHDWEDDGGDIDTCLGVVVTVRHDAQQWLVSVWCAFRKLVPGRLFAMTRVEGCRCEALRRSLQCCGLQSWC